MERTTLYEAHDVLGAALAENESRDADYFKGLIQAAGAFVHLSEAIRTPIAREAWQAFAACSAFVPARLRRNLSTFMPRHHGLDVTAFCQLLRRYGDQIVASIINESPGRLTLRQS